MPIQTGMIILWSGAIVDIPAGYVLCDGNNGTPDLRNRFIVGAGDTYDPGDVGGATEHLHTFTTNGHFHSLPSGTDLNAGTDNNDDSSSDQDTGTTQGGNHLPPYYALAYIMKT